MSIPHPWLLGFGVTALLLVLGATSRLVNSKLWVSEPLFCAAFGVAIGPFGAFAVLRQPPLLSPDVERGPVGMAGQPGGVGQACGNGAEQ